VMVQQPRAARSGWLAGWLAIVGVRPGTGPAQITRL
jgi:hypothetical protein